MKQILWLLCSITLIWTSCDSSDRATNKKLNCTKECKAKNKTNELSCKLTTPELQERKESVLKNLREQIIIKRELDNGYAFKFPGSDNILDQLVEFINTERACCNFFIFGLSISGDKSEIWLELTGPEGAKDFIDIELEI